MNSNKEFISIFNKWAAPGIIKYFRIYIEKNMPESDYGEVHGAKTRKRENAKIDFRVSKLHRELQETRI